LKENTSLTTKNVASLINRNIKTIYGAHYRSFKKNVEINVKNSIIRIPLSIFKNRKLSLLENLIHFLKEDYNLKNNQIALLLNLNQSTISCIKYNIKKKNEI